MPSPGRVTAFHAPGGPGVRMDSALYAGYTVPPYYDSLIAKLIVHDVDRAACIRRLERCLEETVIDGIPSSVPLLRAIFATDDVRDGRVRHRLARPLPGRLERMSWPVRRGRGRCCRPDAGAAAQRLRRGRLPDGGGLRRPEDPLDRAPRAAAIMPLDAFHVPRSLRKAIRARRLRDPRRQRLRGRDPRLRRSRRRTGPAPGSTTQLIGLYVELHRARPRAQRRDCGATAALVGGLYGAARSAARSSARACSRAAATPARWPWSSWSSGCGPAASACSTPSSSPIT